MWCRSLQTSTQVLSDEEATYLLARQMIEAGACAIQIENQVSDEKQCGHQDGKVTVPHADFIAKIRAIRYAFLELGVEDGIIVARTDSLGAGLTKQIAVTHEPGDLGDLYNGFLDGEYIESAGDIANGDVVVKANGKLLKPARLASGLFQFRKGSGEDRVVLDCITRPLLKMAPTCLWIETEKPHVGQIAAMVNRIREVVPDAKLVYNNSPSFNWTPKLPSAGIRLAWAEAGQDLSAYDRAALMDAGYDDTELAARGGSSYPVLPAGCRARGRYFPPPDHPADVSHRGAVHRQPRQGILR